MFKGSFHHLAIESIILSATLLASTSAYAQNLDLETVA